MFDARPRVRLPSPRGLNPNMAPLFDFPSTALAQGHGPARLADACESIAHGLLTAAVTAEDGDVVNSEDLEAAAVWFVAVSKACRTARQ